MRVVSVDAAGVRLSGTGEPLVDVHLEGRRVWSFRPEPGERADEHLIGWPQPMQRFLDGPAAVRVDVDGIVGFDEEVRFGPGEDRVAVVDHDGRALVVDNSGRLAVTLGDQAADGHGPLLDALEDVIGTLGAAGVAAFPAYGTLLGAVRQGGFIAHDTDADVAYLSRFEHPVDIVRESFRLQRVLQDHGHEITRHSGGAFKVQVRAADGTVRGLDVFAGALVDGHLMLMGELYTPYERAWLLPLGTVRLEERTFPAPADPERLLATIYGPSWRVPDPAFSFDKDPATERRLDGWFRGTRAFRHHWDRRYSDARNHGPNRRPHDLAQLVHDREPGATVVDLGCGRGQDAVWLALQGHRALGLDFAEAGFAHLAERGEREGWPVEFHSANLLELRHTLAWGARLSRLDGPVTVTARHLLDATSARGRRHVWRLCRMTLGGGGRSYVEFLTAPGGAGGGMEPRTLLTPLDPDQVAAEAASYGGRVVELSTHDAVHTGQPGTVGPPDHALPACRMVMEWTP
jgi:SAM-dependent methyltransferase